MTTQIEKLVNECETGGRSFGSVRREFGDEIYTAVRDECVARGRGQIELYDVEVAGGVISGRLNPSE